jgi:hypothetical protein
MKKNNKSFVESQPEGALKDTFFKYIPDAQQISNYLKQFTSKNKKGYTNPPRKPMGNKD